MWKSLDSLLSPCLTASKFIFVKLKKKKRKKNQCLYIVILLMKQQRTCLTSVVDRQGRDVCEACVCDTQTNFSKIHFS